MSATTTTRRRFIQALPATMAAVATGAAGTRQPLPFPPISPSVRDAAERAFSAAAWARHGLQQIIDTGEGADPDSRAAEIADEARGVLFAVNTAMEQLARILPAAAAAEVREPPSTDGVILPKRNEPGGNTLILAMDDLQDALAEVIEDADGAVAKAAWVAHWLTETAGAMMASHFAPPLKLDECGQIRDRRTRPGFPIYPR